MSILTIKTREQFEHWLADNAGFADARVLSLSPVPASDASSVPSEATIELADMIEGNYKAHSTRLSRVLRVRATGIAQYRLAGGGEISPEHWSEGIESVESEYPIAFEIDLPAILTLYCSSISVEALPNLTETVAPWLSDREVFAKIPASLPTPAEWERRFKDLNQDVVWHVYGGPPKRAEEVPTENYEGWFLQERKELDATHQGVFFFSCKPDGSGFRIQIENHNASESLWNAAMTCLAGFGGARIHCGNCEFDGNEFLTEWDKWNGTTNRRR